jgi:hypothetical protein
MYVPQVNDYVIWDDGKGVEGWVYFNCDQYVTIEIRVKPKDDQNYEACSLHRNDRLMVLCYHNQWNQLKYVKSRSSRYEKTQETMALVG